MTKLKKMNNKRLQKIHIDKLKIQQHESRQKSLVYQNISYNLYQNRSYYVQLDDILGVIVFNGIILFIGCI